MDIGEQANHRPLKVVYLSRGFADYMAGLLEGMTNFNEVYYVCAKADESILRHLSDRVHVFKSGAPRVSSFRNLIYMHRFARLIRRLNPDIIHIQSPLIWELLFVVRSVRMPVVLTRHDVVPHPTDHPFPAILRLATTMELEIASAILVHSDCLVKLCCETYSAHIRGKPVRSIPHGIISCYGQSNGTVAPRSTQVLFFGRVDKYKGLEVLAKAWAYVRTRLPEARLVIAGQVIAGATRAQDYYRALFAPFPEVDCRLTRQSEAEVSKLFSESTAIVLPYIEASQSGVLMLAYSFALPAVVSRVGGLADVAKDGFNSLTFNPGDVAQLAQALFRIVTDNELRATLRANIIVEREQVFSWKSIARSIDLLYREVLAERR